MAQIDLRLSTLKQADGTCEILIRFYQGSKINLRAKSGVFIAPDYFEYTINWPKTLEAGVAMPKKMTKTTTMANAEKKGYWISSSRVMKMPIRQMLKGIGLNWLLTNLIIRKNIYQRMF